jgi:large subunit ribosomal protein L10
MRLTVEQKQARVSELSAVFAQARAAALAEYRGLTVAQLTSLRRKAHDARLYLHVVKNNVGRRAVAGSRFECLQDSFVGPLALAVGDDPVVLAKVLNEFAKDNELLVTRALAVEGELYPPENLAQLASLPTLERAREMLLGVLQAPVAKLVRTLAEPVTMLARVLQSHAGKQQQ